MGTPQIAAATLDRLVQGHDRVVGVVTQPPRPAGRGQKTLPSPVAQLAETHGIPVIAPEKIRDSGVLGTLKGWSPEIIVVVAFGRILPASILDLAPRGCVNVHYSLLPKYRGAAPAAWTIINGETESGVTTMKLVEKMDAGPIYLQARLPLAGDETTGSLQAKLTPIGAELLLKTLEGLKDGSIAPQPQDDAAATLAPMIKKQDGLIDWTQPAQVIERRVRGFSPWPSAFTYVHGKLLKIHRAALVSSTTDRSPGEVLRADVNGFWIATGGGILSLDEVQLENKKRLPGGEFVNGARIEKGEHL